MQNISYQSDHNNSNRTDERLTLQDIINYLDKLQQIRQQQQQQIFNIIKEDDYKLLNYGKQRNLSNLSPNLKKLFIGLEDTVVRCGITTRNLDPTNMTFFMSLLYCLDTDMILLAEDVRERCVSDLKSSLAYNMKHYKLFEAFKYNDLKWKKKTIIDDIASNNISKLVILYILDSFNINLLVLDVENDCIIMCYSDQIFDPYKNTIIVTLYDNVYEPIYILNGESKMWKYSNPEYRKLLENIMSNPNAVEVVDFSIKNKIPKTFVMPSESNIQSLNKYFVNLENGFTIINNKYYLAVPLESQIQIPTPTQITLSTPHVENVITSSSSTTFVGDTITSTDIRSVPETLLVENSEDKLVHISETRELCNENTSSSEINITKEYSIIELKRMKLVELLEVAFRLGIVQTLKNGKYKTKNQLLIEISDYYERIKMSMSCKSVSMNL